MAKSPAALLIDVNGNIMPLENGDAIPAGSSGLLLLGADGSVARFIALDSAGRVAIQNPPNLDATLSSRLNTFGQKTMGASAPVVLASDQSSIPVSNTDVLTTSTLGPGTEVAVGASAVQLLAANANRKLVVIQNTGAGVVRIGDATVTATTGLRLSVGAIMTMTPPFIPTNAIFGIRDGAVSSVVLVQVAT